MPSPIDRNIISAENAERVRNEGRQQTFNSDPGKPDVSKQQKQVNYSFTDANNYPQHYYLELFTHKTFNSVDTVMCPFVNNLAMSQPLAVNRTWTFDGTPYEEHSGFQQRMFTITGRSGFSFTALSRFAKFRNFFEKYAKLMADNQNAFVRDLDPGLALNFPWEGEAFWCTLISFNYTRSISSSRVSYEYQLVLVTNGVASQRWDPANGLSYVNCDNGDGCHLDPRHFCQTKAREEITLMPSDVYDTIGGSIEQPLGKVLKTAEGLTGGTGGRRSSNPGYYQKLWQESSECFDRLYFNFQALPAAKRARARLSVTIISRWLVDVRIQCEVELGSRGMRCDQRPSLPTSGDLLQPQVIADRGQMVIVITLTSGETTAHDVAGRYLGDRNLWLQIVRLNGMLDARTKNDGSPLLTNDRLLLPSATGVPNIGDVYGTNFLIRDGDLVAEGDEDIVLVSGIDNFYQNLRHRLLTTQTHNKPYPKFGLPDLHEVETTDVPGQVLRNVKNQVLADHRVARLTELTVEEAADKLKVDFSLETVTADKSNRTFDYRF